MPRQIRIEFAELQPWEEVNIKRLFDFRAWMPSKDELAQLMNGAERRAFAAFQVPFDLPLQAHSSGKPVRKVRFDDTKP